VIMGRRAYVTAITQRRLHQQGFRERVLAAYRQCCAVCRLTHSGLLDAAHILPDCHPKGEPWVSNGLALCKIHHAAYDQNILGISGALEIKIRQDILLEVDGPMLRHGLQELDGKKLLVVPKSQSLRPRVEFLEERYREFLQAG
jgi:putative restriction endonuclease